MKATPIFRPALLAILILAGCQYPAANLSKPAATTPGVAAANAAVKLAKRYTYTPRSYPVDERGFSPVDKALAKAYAREDMVVDDDEGALNP